jgi:hypothetical protein
MSSWKLNIDLWKVSNALVIVQYLTLEGVQWAYESWILSSGRCLISWWQLNIRPWRISYELMVAKYWTPEVVQGAPESWIFISGRCPMSSWQLNIRPWKISYQPMVAEYSTPEGVHWAHESWIYTSGRCPMNWWLFHPILEPLTSLMQFPPPSDVFLLASHPKSHFYHANCYIILTLLKDVWTQESSWILRCLSWISTLHLYTTSVWVITSKYS